MLLCNCKEKIKNFSTAFAIALMSARLEQTVCYALGFSLKLLFKNNGRTMLLSDRLKFIFKLFSLVNYKLLLLQHNFLRLRLVLSLQEE